MKGYWLTLVASGLVFGCSGYKKVDSGQRDVAEEIGDVGGEVLEAVADREEGEESGGDNIEFFEKVLDEGELEGGVKDQGSKEEVVEAYEVGEVGGKIKVVPALIDFGFCPAGVSVTFPFTVQNVGSGPLQIDKFTLSKSQEFVLNVGYDPKVTTEGLVYQLSPPLILKPGSVFEGGVTYTPVQPQGAHGEMRVFSSDPAYPDGFLVHILGNQKVPCLHFSVDSLDFGAQVVGEVGSREVRIEACGEMPLEVKEIRLSEGAEGAGFSLDFSKFPTGEAPGPKTPLVLEPAKHAVLRVLYGPLSPSPKDPFGMPIVEHFEVIVEDNTFAGHSILPISGFAVEERCAMPVIEVAEGKEVKVGTLLHLSGEKSYSPFGAITAYRWEVEQPQENHGSFMPSDFAPDVTFLVGVPGLYRFRLEVDDEAGSGSCEGGEVEVEALQTEVAVFVLTWRPVKPFEPVPPFFGQDLDLHLLHPNAAGVDADGDGKPDGYYDIPWDCFWANPKPSWDNPQPTEWWDDDPRLLYDSTDGSGPEVVLLGLKCPNNNDYRIGVHFFDDHGYGPAEAMIQAYVSGGLVWEGKVTLQALDLWDAAVFHCGSRTVTPIPGPVIKHHYINPSFVVPQ